MTVKLDYYVVEEVTGVKTKINNILDIGSIFKGTEKKIPITIFNSGDETAFNPIISFKEYIQDGDNFYEALTWKKVADGKTSEFKTEIQLPDIKPNSWLTGKQIYYENFATYPVIRTPLDDESWWVDEGVSGTWKTYSGYIEHGEDNKIGRCYWKALPKAKDFIFSSKITVRNNSYAGYILRDTGDHDSGYIVLVQGNAKYFNVGMTQNEGIIQVWGGKFSTGITGWTLLGQSGTIGLRGTHDLFKVKVSTFMDGTEKSRIDFWYKDDTGNPVWTFVDNKGIYRNSAVPVLCADTSANDNLIYFDELKMEIPTEQGWFWIWDSVKKETPVFGRQYTIINLKYGGVE